MRYLGLVYNKVDAKLYPDVKLLIERCLIVKCMKHILREIMRISYPMYLTAFLAHALNLILASKKEIQDLENWDLKFENNAKYIKTLINH